MSEELQQHCGTCTTQVLKDSVIPNISIGDLCTHCGKNTMTDDGLYVNRIPSWADGKVILNGDVILDVTIDGYLCPECQAVECDECGFSTLDYEIQDTDPPQLLCADCLNKKGESNDTQI